VPQLISIAVVLIPQLGLQIAQVLTNPGNLLSGFGTGSSILAQLVSAGGGNAGAANLLTEFASLLGGNPAAVIAMLLSSGNLLYGFTNGSSILTQLPALLTLPMSAITGLLDLLGAFIPGVSILAQLANQFFGVSGSGQHNFRNWRAEYPCDAGQSAGPADGQLQPDQRGRADAYQRADPGRCADLLHTATGAPVRVPESWCGKPEHIAGRRVQQSQLLLSPVAVELRFHGGITPASSAPAQPIP
jgi:hypothetical protein